MTDQQPDLSGFLMAHRGFRVEFGRLAVAAQDLRDEAQARLVEEQIELVLHVLHHHHTAEDTTIWPVLRARAPEAGPALDRLEAQHDDMDPLFAAIADRTTPLTERADHLQALHELLNDHLDEEERVALPLIREHITAEEWAEDGRKVQESMDRRQLPLIFGWLASASTPEQQEAALREVPLVLRVLFRTVWGPAYAKRFTALYGGRPSLVGSSAA
jgi:iron-sulfur cluster repair protein YtfE (RIC family)